MIVVKGPQIWRQHLAWHFISARHNLSTTSAWDQHLDGRQLPKSESGQHLWVWSGCYTVGLGVCLQIQASFTSTGSILQSLPRNECLLRSWLWKEEVCMSNLVAYQIFLSSFWFKRLMVGPQQLKQRTIISILFCHWIAQNHRSQTEMWYFHSEPLEQKTIAQANPILPNKFQRSDSTWHSLVRICMKWYRIYMIFPPVHSVQIPVGLHPPTKPTAVGMPRSRNKVQAKIGHR